MARKDILNIADQEKYNKLLKAQKKIHDDIAGGTKIYLKTKEKLVKIDEEILEYQKKVKKIRDEERADAFAENREFDKTASAQKKASSDALKSKNLAKSLQDKMQKSLKSEKNHMLDKLGLQDSLFVAQSRMLKEMDGGTAEARDSYGIMGKAIMDAQDQMKTGTFDSNLFMSDIEESLAELGPKALEALDIKDEFGSTMREALEGMVKSAKKVKGDLSETLSLNKKDLDGLDQYRAKFKKVSTILQNPTLWGSVAIGVVVAGISKLIKSVTDFSNETGFSYAQMVKWGPAIIFAKEELVALMDETGSLNDISYDTVLQMKMLTFQYGVSAASAAKLSTQIMAVSGMTRKAAMNSIIMTGELARQNGVAPAKVLEDVAENTEFFAGHAKDGGKNLMIAAIEARKLGVSMSTTAKIADGLLDFENSIEKSMEASLLLGRNINLDRARQLMINGDMVGMQREVLSLVGSENQWNQLGIHQRKALAESIGVGVDELAKMIVNQEKLNEKIKLDPDYLKKQEEAAEKAIAWSEALGKLHEKIEPIIASIRESLIPSIT
jgi:hypothetical protein